MDDSGYEYNQANILGHGAFAIVYKGCYKKDPKNQVAIKVIEKKNLEKNPAILMKKEIKILQELQHENIVRLYDCRENDKKIFLVMEFCNASDMSDFMKANKMLSEETIQPMIYQLAQAMEQLGLKGIMHRDLKPQNILLHKLQPTIPITGGMMQQQNLKPEKITVEDIQKGRVILKLADFGFARFLSMDSMAATLCGSPMYMAPEVITSQKYRENADLWSIGVIVFQALTTRAPFPANNPQQLRNFYMNNVHIKADLPRNITTTLKNLLHGLLEKDPNKRLSMQKFFQHNFVKSYHERKMAEIERVKNAKKEAELAKKQQEQLQLQQQQLLLQQQQKHRAALERNNSQSSRSSSSQAQSSQQVGNSFQYKVDPIKNPYMSKGSHSPVGAAHDQILSASPSMNNMRHNSGSSQNSNHSYHGMNSRNRMKHDSGDDILNDYVVVDKDLPSSNQSVGSRGRAQTIANPQRSGYHSSPSPSNNFNAKLQSPGRYHSQGASQLNPRRSNSDEGNTNFNNNSSPRGYTSQSLIPHKSPGITSPNLNTFIPQNLNFSNINQFGQHLTQNRNMSPNGYNLGGPQSLPTQLNFQNQYIQNNTMSHSPSNNHIRGAQHSPLTIIEEDPEGVLLKEIKDEYRLALTILAMARCHSEDGIQNQYYELESSIDKNLVSHSNQGNYNTQTYKYYHSSTGKLLRKYFNQQFTNEIIKGRSQNVLLLERYGLYNRVKELSGSSLQKIKNAASELKNRRQFSDVVSALAKLYQCTWDEIQTLQANNNLNTISQRMQANDFEDDNEIEQDYNMQASTNSNGMSDLSDSQIIRSTDKLTYLYALNLSLFAANTETYLKELVTYGKSQSFKSRQRSPSQALSSSTLMQISGEQGFPSSDSHSGSSNRSPVENTKCDCSDGQNRPNLELSEAATLTNASSNNSPSLSTPNNCKINDGDLIIERQSSEESNSSNKENANKCPIQAMALNNKKNTNFKETERYYLKHITKYYEKSYILFKSLEQRHTTVDKSLYSDYLNAIISRLVKLRPHRRLSSSDNNNNSGANNLSNGAGNVAYSGKNNAADLRMIS